MKTETHLGRKEIEDRRRMMLDMRSAILWGVIENGIVEMDQSLMDDVFPNPTRPTFEAMITDIALRLSGLRPTDDIWKGDTREEALNKFCAHYYMSWERLFERRRYLFRTVIAQKSDMQDCQKLLSRLYSGVYLSYYPPMDLPEYLPGEGFEKMVATSTIEHGFHVIHEANRELLYSSKLGWADATLTFLRLAAKGEFRRSVCLERVKLKLQLPEL